MYIASNYVTSSVNPKEFGQNLKDQEGTTTHCMLVKLNVLQTKSDALNDFTRYNYLTTA